LLNNHLPLEFIHSDPFFTNPSSFNLNPFLSLTMASILQLPSLFFVSLFFFVFVASAVMLSTPPLLDASFILFASSYLTDDSEATQSTTIVSRQGSGPQTYFSEHNLTFIPPASFTPSSRSSPFVSRISPLSFSSMFVSIQFSCPSIPVTAMDEIRSVDQSRVSDSCDGDTNWVRLIWCL